jgi:hypothetical protein
MIRLPRSRMRPVPQQRTQVSWRIGAGRSLCAENRRFPKSIWNYPWFVFGDGKSEQEITGAALRT